jgi:hypothetical protein
MRYLTTTTIFISLLLPSIPVIAQTQQDMEVRQLTKELGLKGLDSVDDVMRERREQVRIINATIDAGSWSGRATNAIDKNMRQQLGFNVVKSVLLDTKVIGHFKDPNCKRIMYHYTVTTTKAKEPQEAGQFAVNQCRDGAPIEATPEEVWQVTNNIDVKTGLVQATVRPYTEEEEKTQMVRLIKKAISQPGKTVIEPMEDANMAAQLRTMSDRNANVTFAVTTLEELPQTGCYRIRVESLTDKPFKTSGQQIFGYMFNINACEHGDHSVPLPSTPEMVFTKPTATPAKQNVAAKSQSVGGKAVLAPVPTPASTQPKTTAAKPSAIKAPTATPASANQQGKK